MLNKFILFCLLICPAVSAETRHSMQLPPEVRDWYHNFGSGSCVQCSIGMVGVHLNNPNAASLLWDTVYGSAEIGGSGPSRVANYAKKRNLKIYNVTANNYATMRVWFMWAVKTGRFAAIGAGSSHFQTLYGYDETTKMWLVCNNNSPHRIDEYTEEGFRRLHEASGYWAVFLVGPATPKTPEYIEWWK